MGSMPVTIGRRELIAALGSAAAWPLAARAQSVMPVIRFLRPSTRELSGAPAHRFSRRLEGDRICRGPEPRDRISLGGGAGGSLGEIAAELVRRQVAVIVTFGARSLGLDPCELYHLRP